MVDWCSAVIRLSNSLSSPSVFFNSDSLVDGFPQGTEIPMSRTVEKRRGPWTQVAPRTHTARDTGRTSGDEGLAGRFVPRAAKFPQRKTSPSSTLSGRHCLYPGDRLSPEALDQPKPLSLIPGTISYAWLTLCSDIQ